jgi:hypothetical protein
MTARSRVIALAAVSLLACSDDVGIVDAGTSATSSSSEDTLAPEGSSSSGELDGSSSSSGVPTPSAECGNGVLEFGEDCDDAKNGDPDDGCTDDCNLPGCGDGYVQPSLGEACDAGAQGDVFCGSTCGSRHTLQWVRELASREGNDDYATGVAIDGAGNVIAIGTVDDTAADAIGRNLWLRKYAPDGRELWTRIHDSGVGASNDYGAAVAADAEGNVYAAGVVPVMANGDDGIVLAYDPAGELRWTAMHQGAAGLDDDISAIAITADDRLLIAGFVFDDPDLAAFGWYGLLDVADGAVLFTDTVAPAAGEYARLYAAAVGPEGQLAVAGVLDQDNVVRVLEPDGSERWSLVFDAISDDEDAARGVAFTPTGDVLVAGSGLYAYLRSFDADGAEVWSQVYGFAEASARDVAITSDGVVVMIGDDSSLGSSGRTPVVFGIDPENGAEVWRNAPLGGAVVGYGMRVAAGADGAFAVVGGESPHIFEGDDLWVAAYRPE